MISLMMERPVALLVKTTTPVFCFSKATTYALLLPLSPQCQKETPSSVFCNPQPSPQEM
jgi:hypothetical protein